MDDIGQTLTRVLLPARSWCASTGRRSQRSGMDDIGQTLTRVLLPARSWSASTGRRSQRSGMDDIGQTLTRVLLPARSWSASTGRRSQRSGIRGIPRVKPPPPCPFFGVNFVNKIPRSGLGFFSFFGTISGLRPIPRKIFFQRGILFTKLTPKNGQGGGGLTLRMPLMDDIGQTLTRVLLPARSWSPSTGRRSQRSGMDDIGQILTRVLLPARSWSASTGRR